MLVFLKKIWSDGPRLVPRGSCLPIRGSGRYVKKQKERNDGFCELINIVFVRETVLQAAHKILLVLAGSLWTSIVKPGVFLSGGSGGVYALIMSHLGNVIVNHRYITTTTRLNVVFSQIVFDYNVNFLQGDVASLVPSGVSVSAGSH